MGEPHYGGNLGGLQPFPLGAVPQPKSSQDEHASKEGQ